MTEYTELLLAGIDAIRTDFAADRRWKYYKGHNDLPFAPRGVNQEYNDLREQASLPLIRLAVKVPVQRLRLGGVRSGANTPVDLRTWDMLKRNRMTTKSKILFTHALVLGYGVVSAWFDEDGEPVLNVEDPDKIFIAYKHENPHQIDYVVKTWHEEDVDVAMLYLNDVVQRYEGEGSNWRLVREYDNPFGRPPFVVFSADRDADGTFNSMVDPLVPIQRSIDTMRFNSLLAAQFAAYRQRIITGYDPTLRDLNGNVLYAKDEDGNPIVTEDGQFVPAVGPTPELGVNRMVAFPGEGTKVFDLEESNLQNYEYAIHSQIAAFSSVAQVPPQYLIPDFKNVSGDLLVATEASLRGFLSALQEQFGDAFTDLLELLNEVVEEPYATFVVWQDADPKSLGEIADAASKMVPNGTPIEVFLGMLPNADQQQIAEWKRLGESSLQKSLERDMENFNNL